MSKSIIKFYATWCKPCKNLTNTMKDLDLYELACGMTELDIDDENGEELQQQYQIKTIPTLILLQDGKEISRLANSKSTLQEIKDWINQ